MKSLLTILAMLFAVNFSYSQNTFPSTGNVGIGTTTPGAKLDIQGGVLRIGDGAGSYTGFSFNSVTGLTQENNNTVTLQGALRVNGTTGYNNYITGGNVGIGTTTPESGFKLDVNGLGAIGTQSSARIYLGTTDATHSFIQSRDNSVGQHLSFYASSYNFTGGNVGIGTTTPDAALAVNGTIHTKEIKVDLLGWADYVFKPTYQLPKLTEVKSYIDQNQHLPDMPSEAEVKKDGINLGEMVKLQTKKIEELTLYLIEKDKEKKEQDKRLTQLEDEVKILTQTLIKRDSND